MNNAIHKLDKRIYAARRIVADHSGDGIDRRGFLECMAWAGTGLLWTLRGGAAFSQHLGQGAAAAQADLSFVQISDSHIGFNKEANKDVTATLLEAVNRIKALPVPPAFVIHTGDLSHLSKPEEFDTLDQVLRGAGLNDVHFVPGEHDMLNDEGRQYLERYGRGTRGSGWYSFDQKGVHFIGLVNVTNLKAGGLGALGPGQLKWLENDVKGLASSTPIVVFAHIPLWTVYPDWGWGTDDSAQALACLKRFGSVTVLNGHIHQTMQKIEGSVTFHTAASTAFPQPKPGAAPSPGPMKVPAEELRGLLGITEVSYVRGRDSLAIVDSSLATGPSAAAAGTEAGDTPKPRSAQAGAQKNEINIDNFSFSPAALTVPAGARITWTNRDDIPHNVVSTPKRFASPVLDTDQQYSYEFTDAGEFPYYCSIHPRMTGRVIVEAR